MPKNSGKLVEQLLESLFKTAGFVRSFCVFFNRLWANRVFLPVVYTNSTTGFVAQPQDTFGQLFTVSTVLTIETKYFKKGK